MVRLLLSMLAVGSWLAWPAAAQDKPFSGPQAGEKLPPFRVRGVFDADAGKEFDFVSQAAGKPILLVFVHDANRPSIAMTRVLTGYAATRAKDGLACGTVWLAEDVTEAEATLKRMRHALVKDAPIGVSIDGREGPGAYGLNRDVTLTILVGKEGKATANFALVQPSLQADLPGILKAIAAVVGGPVPKVEDLPEVKAMTKGRPPQTDPKIGEMMRAVIRKSATPEQVDKAAADVEKHIKEDAAARKEVGRIAKAVVEGGKLEDYGIPRAREHLRKWAKEHGGSAAKARPKKDADKP